MEPFGRLGRLRCVSQAIGKAALVGSSLIDDEGFDGFYRREYVRAVRLAWLLTGSGAVAEDVAQDAMAGLYRRFANIHAPDAYLRRAVVNLARTWERNERRQRERVVMLERGRPVLAAGDAELLDLVQRLPYRQRVVIVARYWGGWTESEIARTLGCRQGTVKSLASRALARLREEMTR
jgi:RNA polymerase sigma factor (sigma-70 family)